MRYRDSEREAVGAMPGDQRAASKFGALEVADRLTCGSTVLRQRSWRLLALRCTTAQAWRDVVLREPPWRTGGVFFLR